MQTSEVLYLAADLIEERGWRAGSDGWSGSGPLCIEGALTAAAGLPTAVGERLALYRCPAYWAVADHLALNPKPRICPVKDPLWGWNDRRTRTQAEVIETLRAAAVIEAAKEAAAEQVAQDAALAGVA